MATLHVHTLSTGQTVCIVHHHVRTWTHTIPGGLQEDKIYARWQLEPGIQARIRCQKGTLVAEIHVQASASTHIIHPEPSPYQYQTR